MNTIKFVSVLDDNFHIYRLIKYFNINIKIGVGFWLDDLFNEIKKINNSLYSLERINKFYIKNIAKYRKLRRSYNIGSNGKYIYDIIPKKYYVL